jgi:hypothetical protein
MIEATFLNARKNLRFMSSFQLERQSPGRWRDCKAPKMRFRAP